MKKIYALLLLLSVFNLKAQVPTCTIDPTFVSSGGQGIWPDSAVNFISGNVGQAYAQNVTVVIPTDTTVSGVTCTYSTVNLQSTTNNYGLPPGLSLTGTPSNYKFPGNANSCMQIYGTPTTAGTYTLTFVLKVYCTQFGPIPATTYTVGYYKIKINAAAGIETNKGYDFNVMQNSPNPVTNNTAIKFTSLVDAKAKLSVYNVTGQKVMETVMMAKHGDNSYDFDATTLESGIYIYALEINGQKQTRRMVVAK